MSGGLRLAAGHSEDESHNASRLLARTLGPSCPTLRAELAERLLITQTLIASLLCADPGPGTGLQTGAKESCFLTAWSLESEREVSVTQNSHLSADCHVLRRKPVAQPSGRDGTREASKPGRAGLGDSGEGEKWEEQQVVKERSSGWWGREFGFTPVGAGSSM